jgi:hypothetical protein
MRNHPFIQARHYDGEAIGTNSKIAIRGMQLKGLQADDGETNIISFRPISFHEYIRIKAPII